MDSHKTEGDVPKDKEVASKKADSPLKTEELALQPADVTMKLDRVFDEIPPNSKERANFEDLFLDDMARALGVPRHLLQACSLLFQNFDFETHAIEGFMTKVYACPDQGDPRGICDCRVHHSTRPSIGLCVLEPK